MQENELREMIKDFNMPNKELFIRFFQMRFPNESPNIKGYVTEWVERFLKADPTKHMDSESFICYQVAINEVENET